MTDLASDFDFAAESQAAEAAALEAEGFAPETVQDDQPAEQPQQIEGQTELAVDDPGEQSEGRRRDPETGQFLPNEDPALTAEEQQAADDFYVDRYKSKEEGERGIREMRAETQRAQAERDQERREKEQYRQQVEQYENWVRQQQEAAQHPQTPANFDDLVDENPAYAAQLAYQARDQHALQRATQAWDELAPGAPAVWWQNIQLQQRLEQVERNTQAQTAPMQERFQREARDEAIRAFNDTNPWFARIPSEALMEVAQQNPALVAAIEDGDPQTFVKAMRALGLEYMNQQQVTESVVQDIARTQATEAQRAREDAFVASSGTQTAQEPVTAEDQEAQRFEERVLQNQNKWQDGWDRPADGSLDERLAKLRGQNDPDRVRRFGLGN